MKTSTSKQKNKSFQCFFIVVLILLGITTLLGIVDIWKSEIVEKTGTGEERGLLLLNGTQVQLGPESEIRFHKGSPDELILKGEAYFEMNESRTSLTVDTRDLRLEAEEGVFQVVCRDSTKVEVISSILEVHLRDSNQELSGEVMYLGPGESVTYMVP